MQTGRGGGGGGDHRVYHHFAMLAACKVLMLSGVTCRLNRPGVGADWGGGGVSK